MSQFDLAFFKTMGHEGGYSNDPDDPGGETYRGISRKYHPDWEGWKQLKNPRHIDHVALQPPVAAFYEKHYWNPLYCGKFPQQIADEMFDTGVNMGLHYAATFLQRGLNILNRNQELYGDIVADGQIGPVTLSTFTMLPVSRRVVLAKVMNIMQGAHYVELMERDSKREKWVGWFGRVSL